MHAIVVSEFVFLIIYIVNRKIQNQIIQSYNILPGKTILSGVDFILKLAQTIQRIQLKDIHLEVVTVIEVILR